LDKLPEVRNGISEEDIEALNDLCSLYLASNEARKIFGLMMAEGIEDKRRYSTPLQALLWIAYDREFSKENPLEYFSLRKLIRDAWRNTTVSANYTSERWQNFDEVRERLNSPRLVSLYMMDNIAYDPEELKKADSRIPLRFATPEDTFLREKGVCNEQARFALHCLLNNGYDYDSYEATENSAVMLGIDIDTWKGHDVCLVKEGSVFYTIDNGSLRGPFSTVLVAVNSTANRINKVSWDKYFFRDVDLYHTKVVKAGEAEYLTPETKRILIDGIIDEWPSDIITLSDPLLDVSNKAKDKRGIDIKTIQAFMDEEYLYLAIQINDVFAPILIRHYFVALDFNNDQQDEYHFGIRPNGATWVFDHTMYKNNWSSEEAWGVTARGAKDTIELRIMRMEYGIPSQVWIHCRITEDGPTVDSTEWFNVH